MQVGETILTLVREDRVRVIKCDKVVKETTVARHLTIAKGIMTDHTTQHHNINKPQPILHPLFHLW